MSPCTSWIRSSSTRPTCRPSFPSSRSSTSKPVTCPCCRQHWQGRHPEQTSDAIGAAGNTLGPVVLTMAAEMKHRLGVSYRKIFDFLQTYCQLKVCPATFIRAEQRLADLARPTYELLLEALRQSHVVHADETGWRVGRLNAWLWVFSSKARHHLCHPHGQGRTRPPGSRRHSRSRLRRLPGGRWPEELRRPRSRQGPLQRLICCVAAKNSATSFTTKEQHQVEPP